MSTYVSLRHIKGGYVSTLVNVVMIAVLVLSTVSILQIYNNVNTLIEEMSSITNTVIILKPNASFSSSLFMGPIPRNTQETQRLFNHYKVYRYDRFIYNNSFKQEDLYRLDNIEGVEDIAGGLTITIYLYRDINVSVQSDNKYLYKPPLDIYHLILDILAIDARNLSFLADFNDIVEGDFIRPNSNELVIAEGVANKYGFKVGDIVKIYAGAHMYKFRIVGIFSGSSNIFYGYYNVVGDYNYIRKIIEKEYAVFIDEHLRNGSWPAYNRIYIQPYSAYDVLDVASEIRRVLMDKYPNLGVFYHRSNIEVLINTLRSLSNRYNILLYISSLPIAGVLIGLRILDVKSGKRYIALMKAMGWGNIDVLKYTLTYTLVIGLFGGLLGTTSLYILAPLIKNFLLIEPSGTIYVKSIVTKMLDTVLSGFPDLNLAMYAIVYGLLVFLAANIMVVIYYISLEASKILREV